MKIPSKHSPKWILMFLITTVLMMAVMGITVVIFGLDQGSETLAMDFAIAAIIITFFNFLITFMGLFGWFYMWSFTEIALIVSSVIAGATIYDNSTGWGLFVLTYIMVIIEGASLILAMVFQVGNFIVNRKKEERAEGITKTAMKIIGGYTVVLLGTLAYFYVTGLS